MIYDDVEYEWHEVYTLLNMADGVPTTFVPVSCGACDGSGVCSECDDDGSYCRACRTSGACPKCVGRGHRMEQGVWDGG